MAYRTDHMPTYTAAFRQQLTPAERTTPTLKRPAALAFLAAIAAALCVACTLQPALVDTDLGACLGESMPLRVSQQMPYVAARVDGRAGQFVIDFGADVSAITPAGFADPAPQPKPGTSDRYAQFDFFGPWRNVRLLPQASAPVSGGVRQAGVIGTDFLSTHVITLDYAGGRVHRATRETFCADSALARAGFTPLPTQGYYAADTAGLSCPSAGMPGRCPNIPALPVRIGPVQAVAQIDTGFDDGIVPHSMNINTAFLRALQQAGVRLVPRPDNGLTLSTCKPGVTERVEAWGLPADAALEFTDAEGKAVRRFSDATLFVKHPPPAARACGGIGVWPQPAAQLGASFFADDALVVDPFSARVWIR